MSLPFRTTRLLRSSSPLFTAPTSRRTVRSISSSPIGRDAPSTYTSTSSSQSIPRERPKVLAARSTPKGTLLSFAAVLALALPYFIFSKRTNDKKKRERHRQERQGGAMSQMASGTLLDSPRSSFVVPTSDGYLLL
ncbi:BQ2448_806 [Microbotryum intermedium]|uniref:BQ2448_806 protein n=1 Tax=Microbotryum intermedium TaxID=269621 RepID=A0A238F6A4_9BASI|nr:BQ2448_806 [Microbotryum intermedium]